MKSRDAQISLASRIAIMFRLLRLINFILVLRLINFHLFMHVENSPIRGASAVVIFYTFILHHYAITSIVVHTTTVGFFVKRSFAFNDSIFRIQE
jgi:hypothetical protein